MRACDHFDDGGGIFVDFPIYGLSVRVCGIDAAAGEKELRRVFLGVCGDLSIQLDFLQRILFRRASVYYVFRASSARQRAAIKDEDKYMGGMFD